MAVESAVYAFAKLPATREPVSLGPYALNWSMLNFVLMSVIYLANPTVESAYCCFIFDRNFRCNYDANIALYTIPSKKSLSLSLSLRGGLGKHSPKPKSEVKIAQQSEYASERVSNRDHLEPLLVSNIIS